VSHERIALPTGRGVLPAPEDAPVVVVKGHVHVPFVTVVELKKFGSLPGLVPK
jgi:hypothetical protein